jgi:hypothetical protein
LAPDFGGDGFSISMEIRLFRPLRRRSNTAEAFWKAMSTQAPAQGREPELAAYKASRDG